MARGKELTRSKLEEAPNSDSIRLAPNPLWSSTTLLDRFCNRLIRSTFAEAFRLGLGDRLACC